MRKVIEFTRIRFVMIALSVLLVGAGLTGTVLQEGFNLGIDFQAGSSQQVRFDRDVTVTEVRDALQGLPGILVQSVGSPDQNQFSIRVRDTGEIADFSSVMPQRVMNLLQSEFGAVEELESAYVGPRFAGDLASQAAMLTTLALALILIYLWFRFRLGYAVAAIAALLHDVFFMLGFIGALQIEVSTATIAAVLTIVGYSLNDTIVIFDRIRENESLLREAPFSTVVNTSITQSLSRTLITSLTTLLAVLAIYIFATGSIQDFALNLMVGIVVGTYSSVFIASPTLLGWHRRQRARGKQKTMEKYGRTAAAAEPARRSEAPAAGAEADALAAESEEPQAVTVPDADAVKRELQQKKQQTAGRNVPRAKRKKKR